MKKFAVAYISFFDNVLHMEIVEAESDLGACYKYILSKYPEWKDIIEIDSIEELKQECFDGDCMISVLEIG